MNPDIYSYIRTQEALYESGEIHVGDNWEWNMRKHVQLIFHLKNGVFYTGENNYLRAFKAVMEPILGLCYWTEDIEGKDITFYIEGSDDKVLSFLFKKYHDEVYVREHDIDALLDQITESDLDYGGVIVQKGSDMPEVLNLIKIAFCDQTDIVGGPLGIKFYFTPDKLRSMSSFGWGSEANGATISLDELAVLAQSTKQSNTLGKPTNQVSGKTIEVYLVRGSLPEGYLKDNDNMEDYYNQLQIVAFYTNEKDEKVGVTLYRKKDTDSNIKFFTSKEVEGRGLGRGIGESLLHDQIWTNFLTIHKMGLLEAASKVVLYTDDPTYAQKNKISDLDNLEVTTVEEGKKIGQVPTAAVNNIQLYENDINAWYNHAQGQGSAFDSLMGKQPSSGSTFRGQERVVAQGQGSHDMRRGKRAKFAEDIYRSWIIPDIIKDIKKGKKFLASLSMDELSWVAERMSVNLANQEIKKIILEKGRPVSAEEQALITKNIKQRILKKGDKHLIEILKGEFDDASTKIGINIAGKQSNVAQISDKLLSIFQFIFANPAGFQQAMQIPALSQSFENILEFGGLSIANFSSLLQPVPAEIAAPAGQSGQTGQTAPNQANQLVAPNVQQ